MKLNMPTKEASKLRRKRLVQVSRAKARRNAYAAWGLIMLLALAYFVFVAPVWAIGQRYGVW